MPSDAFNSPTLVRQTVYLPKLPEHMAVKVTVYSFPFQVSLEFMTVNFHYDLNPLRFPSPFTLVFS